MDAFAESSNPGPPRAATYLQHSSSFALQSIYDNVYCTRIPCTVHRRLWALSQLFLPREIPLSRKGKAAFTPYLGIQLQSIGPKTFL